MQNINLIAVFTATNSIISLVLSIYIYKPRLMMYKLQSLPKIDAYIVKNGNRIFLVIKNYGPIPINRIFIKKTYIIRFWKNKLRSSFIFYNGMIGKDKEINKDITDNWNENNIIKGGEKYYIPLRLSYENFDGKSNKIKINQ